mmetsp:Transcript_12190/g.35697  ORF Transcript_12190/g.35697 Transcript_12190/m.35697 type:complete len:408 (-) Transcript_12190:92-1315(-)
MPPNRQSVTSVIRSLSFAAEDLDLDLDLSSFVTESKYAPLAVGESLSQPQPKQRRQEGGGEIELSSDETAPSAAPQREQQQYQHQQETGRKENKASYWAWPFLSKRRKDSVEDDAAAAANAGAEVENSARRRELETTGEWGDELARRREVVAQILDDATSTANIETGLKRDAAAKAVSAQTVFNSGSPKGADGYWNWDAEKNIAAEAPSLTLSAAGIEENLKKECVRIKVHSHSPQTRGESREGYWNWDTLTPEEERRRKVDSILEDERARTALSAEHIESNLEKMSILLDVERHAKADSNEYWSSSQDAVAAVRDPHTHGPIHPSHAYWDWCPPTTSKEKRQGVLDQVLAEDDVRRALSAARMQEIQRREAEEHAAMERERWNSGDVGMDMGGYMMDAGGCEYWDM